MKNEGKKKQTLSFEIEVELAREDKKLAASEGRIFSAYALEVYKLGRQVRDLSHAAGVTAAELLESKHA